MRESILYTVEYLDVVIKHDIPVLSASAKRMLKTAIEKRLTTNPIGFGKPLRYSLKGHRRLRVGHYRIVYRIIENTVLVIAIKHHKEIYND